MGSWQLLGIPNLIRRRRRCRQREAEEAVAYVLHTARSWAQLRASPADRPQSEQIWCSQVVGGRPRGLRQFGKGGTPSLTSQAMRRTALAGTLSGIRAARSVTLTSSERTMTEEWHHFDQLIIDRAVSLW